MRSAFAMATWVCGLCLVAAIAPRPLAASEQSETTPAPQAAAQPPSTPVDSGSDSSQPPTGGQTLPHNPAQEIAGEQPMGAALDVGPAKLRIGGYVGVTGIYRSTNSGGGPGTAFESIPYEDTLQGNVSETRLTAQSSRISIRVDAPFPEARFHSLSGYFEMDFGGSTPGNIAVTSTSAGLRIRQGFAEIHYGASLWLAAGQAFSLMTPPKQQMSIWPSDYEMSQAVDTNYLAGLVWTRAPQVRLTWRASTTFNWAVSVENPEQQIGEGLVGLPACCEDDIAAQYNTGGQALSVPNLMPDVVTRVALNPNPAFHVDVGGVVRVFRHTIAPYDDVFREVGGGASVNARVNLTGRTRLIGQVAIGSGLGRYLGGLAPDVAFRSNGSVSAIPTLSWLSGIEQILSPHTSVAGYYSGVRIDDTYFVDVDGRNIGFGFPGASNAGNRTIDEVTGTISYLAVRTENRGSAQMNFQTSWLRRQPWAQGDGPASASAFLFFAQLRYNLP